MKPARMTVAGAVLALVATLTPLVVGVSAVQAAGEPAPPTNLELVSYGAHADQSYDALLQWNYGNAEGYLLESRDGTSGAWNCIVAGGYSSTNPSGTSLISTTRGGRLNGSDDWYFRVRLFNSEQFSYAGEATCDANADYGYIFNTRPDEGFNLSQPLVLGPVAIPEADDTVAPDEAPTGLAVTAGARHGDVEISWDAPPQGSNVTGFAVYRKWRGHSNAPNLCLYWSNEASGFITSYRDTAVAAYDTTGNKNQYVYKVYPVNAAVPVTGGFQGCDDDKPTSVPFASVTATLTVDTKIVMNSDSNLEYPNPPAPSGLTLTALFRTRQSVQSKIRVAWETVADAPGYRVRYRKVGEGDWREEGRTIRLENQLGTGPLEDQYNDCTGVPRFEDSDAAALGAGTVRGTTSHGQIWCFRENGNLLTRMAATGTWPRMFNAGPGARNDRQVRARLGFDLLDRNARHEVQVATCTDPSCDTTGPWSASRYATSK